MNFQERTPATDNLNPLELVRASRAWKEISAALERKVAPQTVAFFAPALFHSPFLLLYAHSLLGGEGTDSPHEGWSGENHPDLIIAGSPGSPPGIEECRGLPGTLSSIPVCAPFRLAVIHAAEKLSLPAANSLLKITEEPPPRGRLLLLLEEDLLLPTLRSRSWCLRLPLEEVIDPLPPPATEEEWVSWLGSSSSGKVEGTLLNAARWSRWYALQGSFQKAWDLDSLIVLAQKTRLSAPMVADLLFLSIREDVPIENILGSLW